MSPATLQDARSAADYGGAAATTEETCEGESESAMPNESAHARVREMFALHFDFIWRALRRFGLSEDRADDAAQQVFMVASRKLETVREGSEKSFLFGTAMRVASDIRRSAAYRREIAHPEPGIELPGTGAQPDELLDQSRARALLDEVLDAMELDLRSVFVLYELEEMTTMEIALMLEIPHGTAQSRLRRAREEFQLKIARLRKRGAA